MYVDWNRREQEDLEMENIRADARDAEAASTATKAILYTIIVDPDCSDLLPQSFLDEHGARYNIKPAQVEGGNWQHQIILSDDDFMPRWESFMRHCSEVISWSSEHVEICAECGHALGQGFDNCPCLDCHKVRCPDCASESGLCRDCTDKALAHNPYADRLAALVSEASRAQVSAELGDYAGDPLFLSGYTGLLAALDATRSKIVYLGEHQHSYNVGGYCDVCGRDGRV